MSEESDKNRKKSAATDFTLVNHPLFVALSSLLCAALIVSFFLVLSHPDENMVRRESSFELEEIEEISFKKKSGLAGPSLPYLVPFSEIENSEKLIEETLSGKNPTIAGIASQLNNFINELHESNLKQSKEKAEVHDLIDQYFYLANEYLRPLDEAYEGRSIFDIREDESIFVSLAAFREHLLKQTLESAFDQARDPDQIYVGVVVQNCFGTDGRHCKTGLEVIGKNKIGRDMVKMSVAPPDKNGVKEFCENEKYEKYCLNNQVRVLYLHDTDALGPAIARYYASKLWGGETYFMQMDSHLEFAPDWDYKYIEEVKATKNFPKSVLSTYPPGFSKFGNYSGGTPGSRLCHCEFSHSDVESDIIRINTNGAYRGNEKHVSQIAFIAAGFFFARAEFLIDVPFDPFVPWCFMGEEIALSMRAWTHGWNIYAPRENLIAHQYRPGRLGLPKFWESVGRDSGRPNLNVRIQAHTLRRIKYMIGYTTDTNETIHEEGDGVVLDNYEHYSLGNVRSREEYLELTNIDVKNMKCKNMDWCRLGTLTD